MRRYRRRDDGQIKLFFAGENHERRVIMLVGITKGQQMLNAGQASVVEDTFGNFIGIRKCNSAYEARKAVRQPVVTEEMKRGCVVLSKAEVEVLADRTPSRTARLTDAQRDARVAKGLPEMDLAESARVKFKGMFPHAKDFAA